MAAARAGARARVVILGSGWAGTKVARSLRKDLFDVRVVSPSTSFLFTPLLPSAAVGTLEFRAIQEPVRTIAEESYQAKAVATDFERRVVTCRDLFRDDFEFELPYDWLVVATGCKTETFGIVDDTRRDVCFLKHLSHARKIRNRVVECFERASNLAHHHHEDAAAASSSSSSSSSLSLSRGGHDEISDLLSFVVVGGGATSCEFTTELCDFVRQDLTKWYPKLASRVTVHLVEAGPKILTSFDESLAGYYANFLRRRRVDLRTGVAVTEVAEPSKNGGASKMRLSDGEEVPFGLAVWSAGLAPVNFVRDQADIEKHRGRIVVDQYLRIPKLGGRVFAIGDCAVGRDTLLPPTASVAEQQGAYLAKCFNTTYHKVVEHRTGGKEELPVPAPVPPAAMPSSLLEFLDGLLFDPSPAFRYVERGSMASMGLGRGILDLSKTGVPGGPTVSGFAAFLAWRGAYLSKQLSFANMILVPMFWFKSWFFGRDISRF